jgi:hypothetical protein
MAKKNGIGTGGIYSQLLQKKEINNRSIMVEDHPKNEVFESRQGEVQGEEIMGAVNAMLEQGIFDTIGKQPRNSKECVNKSKINTNLVAVQKTPRVNGCVNGETFPILIDGVVKSM